MVKSIRAVDPEDTVRNLLERKKGQRTQADTDREARRQTRFGAGEQTLRDVVENLLLKGRIIFQRNSDEAIRFNNDVGQTQLLIGTQDGLNPVLLMGNDIIDSTTGYTFKVFALRGDVYAGGLVSAANVDISKWYSGVHHVPGATTLEAQGMPAFTATGAITSVDSSSGSWASVTTAATIADFKGFHGTAARFRTDQGYEAMFRIASGGSTTSQRVWVGMFETDPNNTDTPVQNFVGFRYSTAAGDTNWQCITGDGASRTVQDSGVAYTANTSYFLRLRASAGEVMFSLGMPNVGSGTQNWTITTTLPTSSLLLTTYLRITAIANVAKSFLFDLFQCLTR